MAEMPVQQNPQRVVLPPHRQRASRPFSVRAREWVHRNLFPSLGGTLLTLAAVGLLAAVIAGVVWFVFFDADWKVITVNRKLLFAGTFPIEQVWRLWVGVGYLFFLFGAAYGTWSSVGRRDTLFILLTGGFVVFLLSHGGAAIWSTIWFLLSIGLFYLGYWLMLRIPREASAARRWQQLSMGALLFLALPMTMALMMVGGGATFDEFDGFVLNMILAPVGIVGGLVVAIPLALGRASSYRTISWTCTAYIEVVRGAPLLGWLFVALFILDDIIGGELIVRAMVVMAVFTGAYMAENIRGALQTLPRGQYEAAQAVGLSRWQAYRSIILPQALRISIPPNVGQAIAIWKDTTLVSVILPLRELKGNADSAIAQRVRDDAGTVIDAFTDNRLEAFVFIAVIFWIVAFMMSRISQRVERAQGIGER